MKKNVQEYYGKTVTKTADLQYDACCIDDYDTDLLKPLTEEVLARRYGCGSPIPDAISGLTLLDLGCGSGIDVFIAAQLVGPAGSVIGVDMTDEQLIIARRNVAPIMENLGYDRANVEFLLGDIEAIDLADESVDCIISNCVINLSSDKDAVLREIWRILKPGGEFLVSDIVADRRVPERLRNDAKLYSECLTGADYEGDFRRRMQRAGFEDVRITQRRAVKDIVEMIHFYSITYRGFKIDLEPVCEDFGQVAVYRGDLTGHSERYILDRNHTFPTGEAVRICKNSADILKKSRLAPSFIVSDALAHLGIFDCAAGGGTTDSDDFIACC